MEAIEAGVAAEPVAAGQVESGRLYD